MLNHEDVYYRSVATFPNYIQASFEFYTVTTQEEPRIYFLESIPLIHKCDSIIDHLRLV